MNDPYFIVHAPKRPDSSCRGLQNLAEVRGTLAYAIASWTAAAAAPLLECERWIGVATDHAWHLAGKSAGAPGAVQDGAAPIHALL